MSFVNPPINMQSHKYLVFINVIKAGNELQIFIDSNTDSTSVSSFKQHSVSPLSSMALCPNEGQTQALQV